MSQNRPEKYIYVRWNYVLFMVIFFYDSMKIKSN